MNFCFSLSKEIKVTDPKNGTRIVLSKDTIKSLYGDLGLKGNVVRRIIRAHVTVLKYGLKTGNERVIVIDGTTGRIEADETGTPERVKWYCSRTGHKRLITIHNHPNSSIFSYIDLYSFGNNEQTLCMGVQGHDGSLYSLKKVANKQFNHTEDSLGALFDIICTNPAYSGKTFLEKGEIFVKLVSKHMQWEFMKGGN